VKNAGKNSSNSTKMKNDIILCFLVVFFSFWCLALMGLNVYLFLIFLHWGWIREFTYVYVSVILCATTLHTYLHFKVIEENILLSLMLYISHFTTLPFTIVFTAMLGTGFYAMYAWIAVTFLVVEHIFIIISFVRNKPKNP